MKVLEAFVLAQWKKRRRGRFVDKTQEEEQEEEQEENFSVVSVRCEDVEARQKRRGRW